MDQITHESESDLDTQKSIVHGSMSISKELKRSHDSEIDVEPLTRKSERNSDSLFLMKYMKKYSVPLSLNKFDDWKLPEDREAVYKKLDKEKIPYLGKFLKTKLTDGLGQMFSNVLMSAYIPELKRDDISYNLYVPKFLNGLPMYRNRSGHSAHDTIKCMLEEWIDKFDDFRKSCTTSIVRSGFLLAIEIYQDLTDDEIVGHEILVLAETKNERTIIYIVDNIECDYYKRNTSQSNIHDFIKATLFLEERVLSFLNVLPEIEENDYTCMSCARRAAIYAAIMKDFENTTIWNEHHEPDLFQFHYNHYLHHMNKMLRWFDRTNEFWGEPYWTLWPADGYISYNQDNSQLPNLILKLESTLAYVIVRKKEQDVKMWFNEYIYPAFVLNKDKGGCRTSFLFKA